MGARKPSAAFLPPIARPKRRRRRPSGETALGAMLKRAKAGSELELLLLHRLERAGLPLGEPQYRFVPGRQFRFDRAFPDRMVAVEVQGGTWSQHGHARPSMIQRDCLKLSMAAALGWRVLPVTREMIESGRAVELIAQALGAAPCEM